MRKRGRTDQLFIKWVKDLEVVAVEVKIEKALTLAKNKLDFSVPIKKVINCLVLFLDLLNFRDL